MCGCYAKLVSDIHRCDTSYFLSILSEYTKDVSLFLSVRVAECCNREPKSKVEQLRTTWRIIHTTYSCNQRSQSPIWTISRSKISLPTTPYNIGDMSNYEWIIYTREHTLVWEKRGFIFINVSTKKKLSRKVRRVKLHIEISIADCVSKKIELSSRYFRIPRMMLCFLSHWRRLRNV